MKFYEVFYNQYNIVDSGIYDDDGYHDDYYDYEIEEHIPVKYFDTLKKAKKFVNNNPNKNYYIQELQVE